MSTVQQLSFGELKIPFNRENLRETLEKFQSEADVSTLKKMADHLKLPASPFDKKILLPVLIGELQNEWYKTVQGQVPGQPEKHQKERVSRYLANLEMIKNSDGTDVTLLRIAKGQSAEPRKSKVYRLVESTKDEVWGKYKGQKYLIIKAMKQLDAGPDGKGCTVKQISDTVRDTEETKAPNEKNCAFHINAFGHEGVVECVNDSGKGIPAHEEKKSAPVVDLSKKDEAKGKVEPPKGKGGKKK